MASSCSVGGGNPGRGGGTGGEGGGGGEGVTVSADRSASSEKMPWNPRTLPNYPGQHDQGGSCEDWVYERARHTVGRAFKQVGGRKTSKK